VAEFTLIIPVLAGVSLPKVNCLWSISRCLVQSINACQLSPCWHIEQRVHHLNAPNIPPSLFIPECCGSLSLVFIQQTVGFFQQLDDLILSFLDFLKIHQDKRKEHEHKEKQQKQVVHEVALS